MNEKICFFIGHRDTDEKIRPKLVYHIEQLLIKNEVDTFVVGQYGNFDRMVISSLQKIKKRYPWITLLLLTPYHPADRPVNLPSGFDSTLFPAGMETVPKKLAIVRANRAMVDNCNYLIAYVHHPASNALELLDYAYHREKKGLIHVKNLEEDKIDEIRT